MSRQDQIKALAFYLLQYHPIPENGQWWGKGFTEWRNVAKSIPLFPGHYQPHLPADLGFYDLRLSETREAQAALAKAHGIHGFCYYHYWFQLHRLLESPLNSILAEGKPDFPFCLCWANESWSRLWIGDNQEILAKHAYSQEDDLNHGNLLATIFSDSRYIRIEGRPLFLIYRSADIPDVSSMLDRFALQCNLKGLDRPFSVAVDAHCVGYDFRSDGFDAILAFTPQLGVSSPDAFVDKRSFSKLRRNLKNGIRSSKLKVFDEQAERQKMRRIDRTFSVIPSCFVSWDNSPRRGWEGIIYHNSSPDLYEADLRDAAETAIANRDAPGLLFINAWNEWAEGNHLEPDLRNGYAYLEATKEYLYGKLSYINCPPSAQPDEGGGLPHRAPAAPRARWLRRRARLPARLGIAPLPTPTTAPLEPAQQARPGPPPSVPHQPRVLLPRGGGRHVGPSPSRLPPHPLRSALLGQHRPPPQRCCHHPARLHPQGYGHWLRSVLADRPTLKRLPEPIGFINAWNEWAEGNHLKPDFQWGHGYLEATLHSFSSL